MSRTNDDPRGERVEDYDRDEDFQDDLECLELENKKLKEEIKKLKEQARSADNMICELGAIHEATVDAINGREPSDFMLSSPEVYRAWDLRRYFDNAGKPTLWRESLW